MISSFAYSETWVCSYLFSDEPRSLILKRDTNNKMISLQYGHIEREILFENDEIIHLYTHLVDNGALICTLDKKNKRFEMVSINPLSGHIEGDCIITD